MLRRRTRHRRRACAPSPAGSRQRQHPVVTGSAPERGHGEDLRRPELRRRSRSPRSRRRSSPAGRRGHGRRQRRRRPSPPSRVALSGRESACSDAGHLHRGLDRAAHPDHDGPRGQDPQAQGGLPLHRHHRRPARHHLPLQGRHAQVEAVQLAAASCSHLRPQAPRRPGQGDRPGRQRGAEGRASAASRSSRPVAVASVSRPLG